jgi:Tol biopolymer transport system component
MKKTFFSLFFAAQASSAQTIETYLAPPFPTDLTASADGKTIAWVFNDKGSRNIFVAEAPSFVAKAITNYTGDDGTEISNVEFTPDGNQILFVRGNAPNGNGETANPAFLQTSTAGNICIVNKNGEQFRKLIPGFNYNISPDGKTLAYTSGGQIWTLAFMDTAAKPEKLFQSRGNQSQLRWSPDSKVIAFVSSRGDHSFIGMYRFATKTVAFTETSFDNDTYPAWSSDGTRLAYVRVPNMNNIIPFVPVREGNRGVYDCMILQQEPQKNYGKLRPGAAVFFLPIFLRKKIYYGG